jgi:hypothetical protein
MGTILADRTANKTANKTEIELLLVVRSKSYTSFKNQSSKRIWYLGGVKKILYALECCLKLPKPQTTGLWSLPLGYFNFYLTPYYSILSF